MKRTRSFARAKAKRAMRWLLLAGLLCGLLFTVMFGLVFVVVELSKDVQITDGDTMTAKSDEDAVIKVGSADTQVEGSSIQGRSNPGIPLATGASLQELPLARCAAGAGACIRGKTHGD